LKGRKRPCLLEIEDDIQKRRPRCRRLISRVDRESVFAIERLFGLIEKFVSFGKQKMDGLPDLFDLREVDRLAEESFESRFEPRVDLLDVGLTGDLLNRRDVQSLIDKGLEFSQRVFDDAAVEDRARCFRQILKVFELLRVDERDEDPLLRCRDEKPTDGGAEEIDSGEMRREERFDRILISGHDLVQHVSHQREIDLLLDQLPERRRHAMIEIVPLFEKAEKCFPRLLELDRRIYAGRSLQ
jgi:hypothetical protein